MTQPAALPPLLLHPAGRRLTSPCLGHCTLDPATEWCLGCGRSGTEIAEWGSTLPERRAAIWRALPDRLAALGAGLIRADATAEDAAACVARALAAPAARLSLALPGRLLGICAGPWRVSATGSGLNAEGPAGRLDWRFGPSLRLLRPVTPAWPAGLVVLACQAIAGLPPAKPMPGFATLAEHPTLRLRLRAAGPDNPAQLLAETVFGPVQLHRPMALGEDMPALPSACLPVAVIDPDGAWPGVQASCLGDTPGLTTVAGE